ncbi:ATP-binding cassette domain-containing protein [Finegoldia magna]|uniref:ATP-binding cassette domain-containing protein n=1 Tax=Finegoldia magna TaxID=1260 RepID=UPI0012B12649|nr:ABC transporter ATP-binding protein [Finegoldia magna]MSB17070.1 ATP-binding cassette domain-containing protein [Finegoldia magna]MSD45875.1 ATP-binding cassette domain-containing protein [Finegoldia magna]
MEILKIQNLSKSYLINKDRKNEVLKDVNLTVNENDYIAIVGASGAGKSTLLNVILGFLNYDDGSVKVFSKEVKDFTDEEISDLRSKKISFVPQDLIVFPALTVKENLEMKAEISGVDDFDYETFIKKYEMEELLKLNSAKNLSGGEIKKLMILRALINEPELLILDEPTANLDEEYVDKFLDLLDELNKKMTIISVTHDSRLKNRAKKVYKLSGKNLSE